MSEQSAVLLQGINLDDAESLRHFIRDINMRIGTSPQPSVGSSLKAREAARICADWSIKNEIFTGLLDKFLEAEKMSNDELSRVAKWFLRMATSAVTFKPGSSLYEKAKDAYESAYNPTEDGPSQPYPEIKWPRNRSSSYVGSNHEVSSPEPSSGSRTPPSKKYTIKFKQLPKAMPGQEKENKPPSAQPNVHTHPARNTFEQSDHPERQSSNDKGPNKGYSSLAVIITNGTKKSYPSRPSKEAKRKQSSTADLDGYSSDKSNSSQAQAVQDTRRYTRILSVGFQVPCGKDRQWCYQVMWEDGNTVTWEPAEHMEKNFSEAVKDFEESRDERRRVGPRERTEMQEHARKY